MFSAFRHFPYLHLRAEKGSGKTLLMEILSAIAFQWAGINKSQCKYSSEVD